MHICVIGSGIAGLTAAHRLSARQGIAVTVVEASPELGGRARVTDGAEHCTRFFMEDYRAVLGLLREIPAGAGAGSVADAVRPVRRLAWVPAGRWVEITHAYATRAQELSLRERWASARASGTSLLIARRSADNGNLLGEGTDYSLRSLAGIARRIGASHTAFVLSGRTDAQLIEPWARHLAGRGVSLRTGARVERLAVRRDGVDVELASGTERYDAAIVTAFVHDAYGLLDRSGIARHLDRRRHVHCRCFTIDLDPREPVLRDRSLRSYAITGLTLVLQPREARCVALTTTLASTAEEHVLGLLRERLPLAFPPARVRVRDNLAPADGVFAGEHVDPTALEDAVAGAADGGRRRVFFAGSWTLNSYGVDSAEAACRSALDAVERLAASADGQPATAGPARHPNALARTRTAAAAWRLACGAGAVRAALAARVSLLDLSGAGGPGARPTVFVADARTAFETAAGLLALRRLRTRPRLVVAARHFDGPARRALDAVGALPAIAGSSATRNAAAAAVRAGESVAFGLGGLDDAQEADATAVAAATGAPLVPLAVSAAPAQAPRLRRRARVLVTVGPAAPGGAGEQPRAEAIA